MIKENDDNDRLLFECMIDEYEKMKKKKKKEIKENADAINEENIEYFQS